MYPSTLIITSGILESNVVVIGFVSVQASIKFHCLFKTYAVFEYLYV